MPGKLLMSTHDDDGVLEAYSLTIGKVSICWPGKIQPGEIDDVVTWLELVKGKMVRSSGVPVDDKSLETMSAAEFQEKWRHKFDEENNDLEPDDDEIKQECCEANGCCAGCGRDLDQLNPSEALHGFLGWLTSRPEAVAFGGRQHGAGVAAELLAEWIHANSLPDIRADWSERVEDPDQCHCAEPEQPPESKPSRKQTRIQELQAQRDVAQGIASENDRHAGLDWSGPVAKVVEQDGVCPECGGELLQYDEVTARCENDHVFMVPLGERKRLQQLKVQKAVAAEMEKVHEQVVSAVPVHTGIAQQRVDAVLNDCRGMFSADAAASLDELMSPDNAEPSGEVEIKLGPHDELPITKAVLDELERLPDPAEELHQQRVNAEAEAGLRQMQTEFNETQAKLKEKLVDELQIAIGDRMMCQTHAEAGECNERITEIENSLLKLEQLRDEYGKEHCQCIRPHEVRDCDRSRWECAKCRRRLNPEKECQCAGDARFAYSVIRRQVVCSCCDRPGSQQVQNDYDERHELP